MRKGVALAALASVWLLLTAHRVAAHGVAEADAGFLAGNTGVAAGPFLYLGAKHMVTGYDHLLFLVGVVFLLVRMKDVAIYVSLFTLGHSTTLLLGVLADIPANAFLVDAIIGLSVVYKGFDNIGGFRRLVGFQPDGRWAVLGFGLIHGLGLATKVQDLGLSDDGLVLNLIAFNVGVEVGQVLALAAIVALMRLWRSHPSYHGMALTTNTTLMAAGWTLAGFQLAGYFSG